MQNILYITRAKLSLTRAHSQNILKTAEALGRSGKFHVRVFSGAVEQGNQKTILQQKDVSESFILDISPKRRMLFLEIIRSAPSFDVLYFRDPYIWHLACFARYVLRKKVIFEVHGSHEWRFGKPFWRFSIASAHGMVFITRKLQEYYGSKKPSVVARSHGFDPELYQNLPAKDILRKELDLPTDKPILLYAGSFLWYPLEDLVRIFQLVSRAVTCVVVGVKPEEAKHIEEISKAMGVTHSIICRTRVAPVEVPKYLSSADVLLNPPARLPSPGSISSKLFEYMASGVPIVSYVWGANDEVLSDHKNAIVIHSTDHVTYAHAVDELLNDQELGGALSARAKEDAQEYTWIKRGNIIVALVEQVVS